MRTILAFTVITLVSCATALPSLSHAQNLYAEVGFQGMKVPGGTVVGVRASSAQTNTLALRGGYDYHPNFGIEVDLGLGIGEGNSEVTFGNQTVDVEVSIDTQVGVFATGKLPLDSATLYARLGSVSLDINLEVLGQSESTSDEGGAFGAGAIFRAGPVNIRVDATQIRAEGDDFTAISATIGWRF